MRAAALAAVCLAACTPDFEASSDVRDLRVLAVQAEPPEAQFDPSTTDPVAVDVHVLAGDPRTATPPTTLHAAICAPTDSHRCDEGPPIDDLGTRPLSTTLLIPPEFVALAQADDDLKGLGGIRVQYSFSVDHGDGSGTVYGSKVLLFSPRGGTPNHNPAIAKVQLSREGVASGEVAVGEKLRIPANVEIGLRPVLVDGSREQYVTTDLRGNTVTLHEQPRYSFFVAPGAEVDRDSADEPLDGVAPPDGLSRITLHSVPGTLWIVVRDGRGGESWVQFPLELSP
jgi:hypothetical protein